MDYEDRKRIIENNIRELQTWEKSGLDWLNKMWQENHGLHDAMGSIYELAEELARHRRQIE